LKKDGNLAETCLAFIDIEKEYDSINRQEIWKVFQRANASKGPMGRIKNMFDKCENSVVVEGRIFKCLEGIDREVFCLLCSAW
jgi:hypothetical protein